MSDYKLPPGFKFAWNEDQRKATQRGARMQIMREWMKNAPITADRAHHLLVWNWFLSEHPGAADWFDEDGAPR